MLQCIPDGLFLFGRALGLLGILRLGLVVALPLNDPTFLLDLGDVERSDVQAGMLLDVVLDLLVGGFALRSSQIQLIHLDFNIDVVLGMKFGQQDCCFLVPYYNYQVKTKFLEEGKSDLIKEISPLAELLESDKFAKRFENFIYGMMLVHIEHMLFSSMPKNSCVILLHCWNIKPVSHMFERMRKSRHHKN